MLDGGDVGCDTGGTAVKDALDGELLFDEVLAVKRRFGEQLAVELLIKPLLPPLDGGKTEK